MYATKRTFGTNSPSPQNKLENFAQRGIIGSERILLSQHKFDDMV